MLVLTGLTRHRLHIAALRRMYRVVLTAGRRKGRHRRHGKHHAQAQHHGQAPLEPAASEGVDNRTHKKPLHSVGFLRQLPAGKRIY